MRGTSIKHKTVLKIKKPIFNLNQRIYVYTYIYIYMSENDINTQLAKAWTAIGHMEVRSDVDSGSIYLLTLPQN